MNIKTKKIKNFFNSAALRVVNNFAVSAAFLLLVAICAGALVFYKYIYLAEAAGKEAAGSFVTINQATYNKVKEFWRVQEEKSAVADKKSYKDPFKNNIPKLVVPVKKPGVK
jgi:hypothetical protein